MELRGGYIEYVLQLSLAMFAGAASYMFNPSEPVTTAALLLIPVLFGYTAYISRDGFRKSSLLSFSALVFAPLGLLNALLAIVIGLGNFLVSVFANGKSFKDYYTATALPLLFTGLIIGGTVFGLSTTDPGVQRQVENITANTASDLVKGSLEGTEIIEMQEQANQQFMQQATAATVQVTQGYVINETKNSFTQQELQALNTAFEGAREDIPQRLSGQTPDIPEPVDISSRVEGSVRNLLSPMFMIALIPLAAFFFYAMHPVTGLLTAIFAKIFELAER